MLICFGISWIAFFPLARTISFDTLFDWCDLFILVEFGHVASSDHVDKMEKKEDEDKGRLGARYHEEQP